MLPARFLARKTSPSLFTSTRRLSRRLFSKGTIITSENGTTYELITPLGQRSHVWLAALNCENSQEEFIVKGPASDDDPSKNWPLFQHELKMQRLFAEGRMIRHMVDFVPESELGGRPVMILEPFQKTLWEARNTRPLSTREIKRIMKCVLLGLVTVHQKGLVYTDLKMENVLLDGFDNDMPTTDPFKIAVGLSDLGTVSEPGTRQISAITYRSPEVHFGKPWDHMTDVWSWGMILAQLLLAQVDFKSPSMYDELCAGTLEEKTTAARNAMAIDFNLHLHPFYTKDPKARELLPPPQPDKAYEWVEMMSEKGIAGEDIQFLVDVLNPLPYARLRAINILESRYLEI